MYLLCVDENWLPDLTFSTWRQFNGSMHVSRTGKEDCPREEAVCEADSLICA